MKLQMYTVQYIICLGNHPALSASCLFAANHLYRTHTHYAFQIQKIYFAFHAITCEELPTFPYFLECTLLVG